MPGIGMRLKNSYCLLYTSFLERKNMKQRYKWLVRAVIGGILCIGSVSCVDEIKFGNSFLDKAPGGTATKDLSLIHI